MASVSASLYRSRALYRGPSLAPRLSRAATSPSTPSGDPTILQSAVPLAFADFLHIFNLVFMDGIAAGRGWQI